MCGVCGPVSFSRYDQRPRRVRDLSSEDKRVYRSFPIRRVFCSRCVAVKNERLDWLADHPLDTKRFAFYVGRRCHEATITEIADELHLDGDAVKDLDKQDMAEQLRRAGSPAPRVIGIDEISMGKGHPYRMVVSDLLRGQAIWFGGKDRSEKSLDEFFRWRGPEKCGKIRFVVMDRGKAFRHSTRQVGNAPQAPILFDKFPVFPHLGQAIDQVRKQEYARLSGRDRRFIQGPKYTLWSHGEHLTPKGRAALRLLFRANTRLNNAYLRKESLANLGDDATPE